jgi:hypothetical protein
MRAITALCILFLGIFEAFTQGAAEDNSPKNHQTPDALGHHLFQAIKTGNYKQVKTASALALTRKDMRQIGHDLIKSVEQKIKDRDYENPADGQAVIQGIRGTFLDDEEIKKQFAKLKNEEKTFKESFNQIHGMDKTRGFDWQKTKYLRTDSSRIKKDRMIPLTVGDLFIHFMAGDKEFRIKLPNCAALPTLGWLTDSDPLSLETLKTK